jgi:DNA-directed RNA polymerase subunit D
MEIIKKTHEKMIIRTDINYSLANAIRRSVEEIHTLAIDEVEIFKNDSALYDEVLAHRIGLVPLKMDSKMGAKTEIDLKLKKVGPGKVYSGDMKGKVEVVYDNIPLTLLEDKQEIEIVATARMGQGIQHAKHVPGLVYYRELKEVKSGNSKIDSIIDNSKGIIKAEKSGSKWICDLSEADVDEIVKIDESSVSESKELLIFVESFGHLDSEKILINAIDILNKNLKDFDKSIK